MSVLSFLKKIFTRKPKQPEVPPTSTVSETTTVKTTPSKPIGVLGEYVKKFESGNNGAMDISWDSTGGTSYGTYQLAAKTKVFKDFIKYIQNSNSPNKTKVLNSMLSVQEWDVGSNYRNTVPYIVWRDLAKANLIQEFEHGFIKHTRYDKVLSMLPKAIATTIESDRGLQEMLWSTVVQHGPGSTSSKAGAYAIFMKCWDGNISVSEFVSAIYADRGTRFKSSTPKVQEAVRNRFKEESELIKTLIGTPGIVDKYN